MDKPKSFTEVLAKISAVTQLSVSFYHEVVYVDDEGNWRAYSGSDTFKDGEQVVDWVYVESAFKCLN